MDLANQSGKLSEIAWQISQGMLGLGVALATHGLGLELKPCCEICDFLQWLSVNFLQKITNHFMTILKAQQCLMVTGRHQKDHFSLQITAPFGDPPRP